MNGGLIISLILNLPEFNHAASGLVPEGAVYRFALRTMCLACFANRHRGEINFRLESLVDVVREHIESNMLDYLDDLSVVVSRRFHRAYSFFTYMATLACNSDGEA